MCRNSTVLWLFMSIICTSVLGQTPVETAENYLEEGEINKAKKIFLAYPENVQAIECLGDIASFEKNWDQAVSYYRKTLETDSNSARYNFKLGGALGMKAMEVSKIQAALLLNDIKHHLNRAAELDRTNPEVRRALVEFYMQIPGIFGGSQDTAEEFASSLKSINLIDYYLAETYIFKSIEQPEMARESMDKAMKLAAESPNLVIRNYLYYELGAGGAVYNLNPDLAIRFLHTYLENYGYKDLKTPEWVYYRIAQIHANQKQKEEALAQIGKALQKNPDFKQAREEKQRILNL